MTDPKDLPYTISDREMISETPGLRVQILSLAEGEKVPWHFHTSVHDIFICLEGPMVVETKPATNSCPANTASCRRSRRTKSRAKMAAAAGSRSCKASASMILSRSDREAGFRA